MVHSFDFRTRLFLSNAGAPLIQTDDAEILSIRKVLRLMPGDQVVGFNGDGVSYYYAVQESPKNSMAFSLLFTLPNTADQFPETHIYIAATKGKTKERMVKDLTPLGATSIIVYQAERSVSKPEKNLDERLQKIAIEACRQCGRSTIPAVCVVDQSFLTLDAVIAQPNQSVLFWEKGQDSNWSEFTDWLAPMHIIYGPEGGFSGDEIHAARQAGIQLLGMGPRIFRTELAAVIGSTLIQCRRGFFSG